LRWINAGARQRYEALTAAACRVQMAADANRVDVKSEESMLKTLLSIAVAGVMGQVIAAPQVIVIEGVPMKPVTAAQAADLKGEFKMSDGRVLYLNQKGRTLMAEMEGMPARELKSAGAARLVSTDGHMDLAFKAAANGNVSAVTLKLTTAAK
jgi:hypothetical protein